MLLHQASKALREGGFGDGGDLDAPQPSRSNYGLENPFVLLERDLALHCKRANLVDVDSCEVGLLVAKWAYLAQKKQCLEVLD